MHMNGHCKVRCKKKNKKFEICLNESACIRITEMNFVNVS